MIDIDNVTEYLLKNKDTKDPEIKRIVDIVNNVVVYLRVYNVAPKHYTISIEDEEENKWLMIQIDEQFGYIDRQVSKSHFEFINGTCFSIQLDELPNIEECYKLKERLEMKKKEKKRDPWEGLEEN